MPMPNLGFGRRGAALPAATDPQWGVRPEVDYGGMSPDAVMYGGMPDDYGNVTTVGDSQYGPETAKKKKGWWNSGGRAKAKKGLTQLAAMTAMDPVEHYKFRTPGLLSGGM